METAALHNFMILHILNQGLGHWDKGTEGELACIFLQCKENNGHWSMRTDGLGN